MKPNHKLLLLFILALAMALAPWIIFAQSPQQKKVYNINKQAEDEIGYAQAVKVGHTLYVSGSVGSGTMEQAAKQVYDELKKTLAAYGATFQQVVKENVFTTDLTAFKKQQAFRKQYYGLEFPAATWVEVRQLYDPSLTLEVELIAELP